MPRGVRVMFTLYVLLALSGIATYVVVGLTHN
jgi:hypothetical protein